MSQQHTVRTHRRSSGEVVREHTRRNRGAQSDIDEKASLAATRAATASASNDGSRDEWQERPVDLSELSVALSAVGAGKAADIAPLVSIRQGPQGTVLTSAINGPGEELPTGALEINDPFAVSDAEQIATVNGRFLRDAIMSHEASDRNKLTFSDIAVAEGQVSVGNTEVVDLDGWSSERRHAVQQLEAIAAGAATDGITKECIERSLLEPLLTERHLRDGDDYTAYLADLVQGERCDHLHNAWANYRKAVREANASGGEPPTHQEWAAENADVCRMIDRDTVGSYAAVQAHHDYQDALQAWAARNGHDLVAIQESAESPNRRLNSAGYQGPSEAALEGLKQAQQLIASCGHPEADGSADALGFVSELSRVLPARSSETDRAVLNSVMFHQWSGRPRMSSCNSYVLTSSGVNAPASLAENDLLLNGHDLNAWTKVASKHLGKTGGGSLRTGHGETPAKYRVKQLWGSSNRNKEPEYETWTAPVAALQAGQVKVATQRLHGDYMSIDPLFPSEQVTAVTIPASSLADIDKRGRKADIEEHSPVSMSLRSDDGRSTQLHWQIKGYSRSDFHGSEHKVRASDVVDAQSRNPDLPSDSVAIKPEFLAASLRFMSGGDKGAEVDLRRWDPAKPLVIAPAGAPTDPHQTDRVSLVMPVRVA